MKKDLFDYIIEPTGKEYRKENIIDDISFIPKLIIPKNAYFMNHHDYLINDAIINYNNETVVAKMFYANMIKYEKYYEKTKDENYDFWARKNGEQLIKELYSIYDKSVHIVNYLFDLKVLPDLGLKKNVREQLKSKDRDFYKVFNKIFSKLYGESNNVVRDDITHNFSNLFFRYVPKYDDSMETGWYTEDSLSFKEYRNIIDEICSLLVENKNIIINKIASIYPKKGTKEYEEQCKKNIDRAKEMYDKLKAGNH